jgi:hypothetical protein
MWRKKVLKYLPILLFVSLITGVGASIHWVWKRFGPSKTEVYTMKAEALPMVRNVSNPIAPCNLTVRHYRQIGREVQFELYSGQSGLAPYRVEISQKGENYIFQQVPHRAGIWLTIKNLRLSDGPATIRIISENDPQCIATADFDFDSNRADEILPIAHWIRQGSEDIMLDVRPIQHNGKLYLKDFANYQDGRNRVYLIDDIVVQGLENGMEIKPGYLYSVIACWIDAPYSEWWNSLRNRSIRQQNIWIKGDPDLPQPVTSLKAIPIPDWFTLARTFTVQFDRKFPKFQPIPGKLVMQYRLNEDASLQDYFNRGITHLPKWEEGIPPQKAHWTEPPGFFGDKDESWFSSLTRKEVEEYADRVFPSNVYALDFEFWGQVYSPAVKQRLLWFVQRVKQNNPNVQMFDYWGGSIYHNRNFWHEKDINPEPFSREYDSVPPPTNTNLDPLPNGQSLSDFFSITPVDIYPKSFFSDDPDGITPNNYLLMSAIHTARINRLYPKQKGNKIVWFAWNRYLPQFRDPAVPWIVNTTSPEGQLEFHGLSTMPASQALAFSLFSLIESDGYYLWHDNQAQGAGVNNYTLDDQNPSGYIWYPNDGKSSVTNLKRETGKPESPRYWDYPSEYFVLGNWMAKQVEDILLGGKKLDLDFKTLGNWHRAGIDQAVVSAEKHLPFVLSVVNGDNIAVLAIDSFQKPNNLKTITIRLPNGKNEQITLYGNWPSLYRGKL